jgi:myosin heavy subunit
MKDKILQIVQTKGPLLPATIGKECSIDSLMAAAYLSELVSNKKIMLSHLKVGGSPLYYTNGQEARLQDYKNNLNEKDQQAFDSLKKEKVLRDSKLSPLMRVSMRTIKDFAVPLKVNKTEIFWKWYLVPNEEALKLITQILTKITEKTKNEPEKEVKEEKPQENVQRAEAAKKQSREIEKTEKQKLSEIQKRERELDRKETELMEKIKEEKEKLNELKKKEKELEIREKKLTSKLEKERESMEEELKQREEEFRKKLLEEYQIQEQQPEPEPEKDEFLEKVKEFCEANNILIEETEVIKKNREVEMLASIPTPVGNIRYFCRAKDKKKCNDGDLSSAYLKGQSKVLPTLFLTTGDLTKKASEMLNMEFKQMVVKRLENGSTDN